MDGLPHLALFWSSWAMLGGMAGFAFVLGLRSSL